FIRKTSGVHVRRAGERGKTWARGGRRRNGRTARQRTVGRLASSRGTRLYRRTRPWDLVQQHSIRRRIQVYGRVGEGRGKCVRKLAEEKRGRLEQDVERIEVTPRKCVRKLAEKKRGRLEQEVERIEVTPRVTVGSLRSFRAVF
ncbi:unnamed protein product, partial [Ascophyllum nodosum]